MGNPPFPLHRWLVALRDTLCWLLNYREPPGEAGSGKVDLDFDQDVPPVTPTDSRRTPPHG